MKNSCFLTLLLSVFIFADTSIMRMIGRMTQNGWIINVVNSADSNPESGLGVELYLQKKNRF